MVLKMEYNVIREYIVEYLKQGNPLIAELEDIPLDESLVELGYMDSFGIVDIVVIPTSMAVLAGQGPSLSHAGLPEH